MLSLTIFHTSSFQDQDDLQFKITLQLTKDG